MEQATELLGFIASQCPFCDRTTAFVEAFNYVTRLLGIPDPYVREKSEYNAVGRRLHLKFRELLERRSWDLELALRMAAIANVADSHVLGCSATPRDLERALEEGFNFHGEEIDVLLRARGGKALILLDNAGELHIDLLLGEALFRKGFKVRYAARTKPYEVDVTESELRNIVDGGNIVLGTGTAYPPLYTRRIRTELIEEMQKADLVVAKGIANLEAFLDCLPGTRLENLFFVLAAKCQPLAKALRVPYKSGVALPSWRAEELCRGLLRRS